ncbi:MAG: formate/nitrite transporter family protein [Kiloniellaceae bacterium]
MSDDTTIESKKHAGISRQEQEDVQQHQKLRAPVIYEIISAEGEEELHRPLVSLWWSGIAAGLCISLSIVAEGLLHRYLPDTPWRPLIENFGYCFGFLIVVLGRLQLFTENTITAILPLAKARSGRSLWLTARLWGVVFAANLVGTLLFAFAAVFVGLFADDQLAAIVEISNSLMVKTPWEMLWHSLPAGFLVAAMVWMMPNAKGSEFWVIVALTYLIALGDFGHVIVGSAEVFILLLIGEIGLTKMFFGFLLPAFVGNVVGGTILFALMAYAQVKEEL